jgi:hypothetical protein
MAGPQEMPPLSFYWHKVVSSPNLSGLILDFSLLSPLKTF